MRMLLLCVGKNRDRFVSEGLELFVKRINRYVSFDTEYIGEVRNGKSLSEKEQKALEGEKLLKRVSSADYLILLDDRGAEFSSPGFARFVEKKLHVSGKRLVFAVGGPYGFSDAVYERADERLSLSRMTFTHQMVRLIFAEQLYRAFTILNNEPYHHE